MIEAYFQRGVRLIWRKESADMTGSRDGSIVDQPTTRGSMIYDGLTGHVPDGSPGDGALAGLRKGMPISFNWLAHKPGHTTKIRLTGDTLTGFVNGCYVATWLDPTDHLPYVGRICTDYDPVGNKRVKSVFYRSMSLSAKGYDANAAWTTDDKADAVNGLINAADPITLGGEAKIVGLIAYTGHFYSILLYPTVDGTKEQLRDNRTGSQANRYVVAGMKQVMPLPYDDLRFRLGAKAFGRRV